MSVIKETMKLTELKIRRHVLLLFVIAALVLVVSVARASADDTCIVGGRANPPNIVILLDNGAAMQQVVLHPAYDGTVDFTPMVAPAVEVVTEGPPGNGFFHENGYAIISYNGNYYLTPVGDDLRPAEDAAGLMAEHSDPAVRKGTWTINKRTVILPATASPTMDAEGIKDNGGTLRYSKNYLNWIFFSPAFLAGTAGDGSDLPARSRFYYAKSALLTMARASAGKAKIGIFAFTADSRTELIQPLGPAAGSNPVAADWRDTILDTSFTDAVNNMETVTSSPLAAGLARVGGYFSASAEHVADRACQKQFVILVTPGVSSEDLTAGAQSVPPVLADYDGDGLVGDGSTVLVDGLPQSIPLHLHGSTFLDDVAHYLYTNDIIGYLAGRQSIRTATIGFMAGRQSNLFLINTANNGNGHPNLYDSSVSGYGRYHFAADSPASLTEQLMAALNEIIFADMSLTAPVVPVTRTVSGNRIYLALFKPAASNFWAGNVLKLGISGDGRVMDREGHAATLANGDLKEEAEPYWATADWADPARDNYIHNSARNIYTYLGSAAALTDPANAFSVANPGLTAALLGNPDHAFADIINFVRGADVFDEDGDRDTTENRTIITSDILHSEPLVVQYDAGRKMVYFGANDGMLHAVDDADGREVWGFIPPDLLPNLKYLAEGGSHFSFVDASPQAYIRDVNGNSIIEGDGDVNGDGLQDDMDGDGDTDDDDRDLVILVCGERKGGTGYFGLDVTFPDAPRYIWRIDRSGGGAGLLPPPSAVVEELGETWSVPQFGLVKTTDNKNDKGTPVFFIGAGRIPAGAGAVLAINALTGAVVRKFSSINGMDYSIPGTVKVLDTDSNGFIDKVYAGDLGGQVWRFGQFANDALGKPLSFPQADENINHWTGQRLFVADPSYVHLRSFYFPPSVTLEKNFDLVFIGSGDSENPCDASDSDAMADDGERDRFYAIKDTHEPMALSEADLIEVTDPVAPRPDMKDSKTNGWFMRLAANEKVQGPATVAFKTLYFATFGPSQEPCRPGGTAKLYAMQYKTAAAILDPDGDGAMERSVVAGDGLPSGPVILIPEAGTAKLLLSAGRSVPEADTPEGRPGIKTFEMSDPKTFVHLWWKEKIDD